MDTKTRILDASRQLFNESGYVNVTMRDISAMVGISPGNLAYHYKNKSAILDAIYRVMSDEIDELLSAAGILPSFENISGQIAPYLHIQRRYRFFFMDTLEICRANPDVALLHRKQTEAQITRIRAFIDYSVGTGNVVSEPVQGDYDRLATTTWMILSFWSSHEAIRKVSYTERELRKVFWSGILPYLTAQGKAHFEAADSEDNAGNQRQIA